MNMFLPTKAHSKEIVDGQYKLRLGNRVPKGAVNLAYTHVPPINSMENIQVTDLSDTILENHRNAKPSELRMYPDVSLLLQDDEGQSEIATEDVLVSHIFEGDSPLFYSYELRYYHYDETGPDVYGIYDREGIVIIDRYGKKISRPYQVQLIPDAEKINLFRIIVYTSFNDEESDEYRVLYNAVEVHDDGRIETYPGYREPLTLKRAFKRVYDASEVVESAMKGIPAPIYHQSNGGRSGTSKLYAPTPRIKDTRKQETFRYQVGVEIDTGTRRLLYTTPWYSESVMNYGDLSAEEQASYVNGFKQITSDTAEDIMKGFIEADDLDEEARIVYRYFVNITNPLVKESMRIDGSSPIYVSTDIKHEGNGLFIPKNARVTRVPVEKTAVIDYTVRPLKAHSEEVAHLSVLIDNSESMSVNDPEKVRRYKMIESLLYSADGFYAETKVAAHYFSKFTHVVQNEFKAVGDEIIRMYEEAAPMDGDVTEVIDAIDSVLPDLESLPENYLIGDKNKRTRKIMVVVTDGEFSDVAGLESRMVAAQAAGVNICLITFSNFPTLNALARSYNNLCIDATSPRLAMELRTFFFELAGLNESIAIDVPNTFSMSPTDNDRILRIIDDSTFNISLSGIEEPDRYAVEIKLNDTPDVSEIAIYLEEIGLDMVIGTTNGAYILTQDMLKNDRSFRLKAHCEAWDFYFSYTYAVRFNDRRKIQVLPPREKSGDLSWYPRIRNGRFDRKLLDRSGEPVYHYSIPEYYRQEFLSDMGVPYRRIVKERPDILNNNQIRVRHTPLSVRFEDGDVSNIVVWANSRPIRVKSWSAFSGILELDAIISDNDELLVDYEYEEDSYVYRGYYNEKDERFWHLDLNPSSGRYVTVRDESDHTLKELPSFVLINKVVYFYIKPSSFVTRNTDGTYRPATEIERYAVFHSFEKVSDPNAILIGEIRVRPNSNQQNISLTDTRVRGGGLKESISKETMRDIEEESLYYWDIGHWDGLPYPENGVIVIRLSKRLLKEHGGLFTKPEIEERLDKYLGYGILAVIEYVEDADKLLQIPEDLVVEVIEVEELGDLTIMKPTFDTTLEDK